jgi:hypothetical protein
VFLFVFMVPALYAHLPEEVVSVLADFVKETQAAVSHSAELDDGMCAAGDAVRLCMRSD